MNSEKLSNKPLDTITLNGPTNFSAGGNAKPGGASRFFYNDNEEMIRVILAPFIPCLGKFRPGTQPPLGRKNIPFSDGHGYLQGIVTTRFLRPLARRRFRTIRPLAVCIRLRKPWVRFLLILLG